MQRVKLDRIDRRILHDLQADGRITNVELSRRAGISAPPCLRRVRALEEAGYILGYHADLDPKSLGFHVTVFAQVGLSSQAEPDLKAFEATVRDWPEVRECYMLAGEPAASPEYAVVVDPDTLLPADHPTSGRDLRVLVACRFGRARLIDNLGVVAG